MPARCRKADSDVGRWVGGPGTDNRHLAIVVAGRAVRQHRRVRLWLLYAEKR
jgi:hypothetical protein